MNIKWHKYQPWRDVIEFVLFSACEFQLEPRRKQTILRVLSDELNLPRRRKNSAALNVSVNDRITTLLSTVAYMWRLVQADSDLATVWDSLKS